MTKMVIIDAKHSMGDWLNPPTIPPNITILIALK